MKRIGHVTFELLDKYINNRVTRDHIKPKTVNMEITFIRSLFEYAISLGYLKKNPAKDLKRMKEVRKPPRYFTTEELEAIFINPGDWNTYYSILLHTGLRAGDVARLTWADIDLDTNLIRIIMEKTDLVVTIPISKQLKQILLDHPADVEKLFNDLDSDSLRRKPRRHLLRLLKAAKMDTKGVGLHTFRHTFASRLVMQGVPLIQISRWLGHTSITMTQIYAHLEPTSGREDINKVDFNMGKIATPELRKIFGGGE